jgi:flagellar hook protein FlgE
MLQSLDSAASGLEGTQVSMDVIGNNIANVSTVGFKSSTVTFEDAMAQVMQNASPPEGGDGGVDPIQVGLGTTVGAITASSSEGNLETTNQITDLAMQGSGYFVFSNGSGDCYSRNGTMQFDSSGNLVSAAGGYKLQGIMASPEGTYPTGGTVGNIQIPLNSTAPAKATTEIKYTGNLDADSQGVGSILDTASFLGVASGTQTLTSLHSDTGNSLGIESGDTLTVSMTGSSSATFQVGTGTGQITTLSDLATSLQSYLTSSGNTGATVTVNASGQLEIDNGSGAAIDGLQVSSSNASSAGYVTSAFNFSSSIAAGATADTSALLRPAVATDLLGNLVNASGQSLGLETGDVIKINGSLGSNPITENDLTYTAPGGTGTATTLNDLLTTIQTAFSLPATDGTPANNPSVSVDAADTPNDLLADGSIVVRSQPGSAFAISGLSITATNPSDSATAPTAFDANASATTIQSAKDAAPVSTSEEVYDQTGATHTVNMTFTPSSQPGVWNWQATTDGGEQIVGGNSGTITFGEDGSPTSFTYADGSSSFEFNPGNGASDVSLNLNVGTPGSLTGLTEFASATTASSSSQDGYTMGTMQSIAIDQSGNITGSYSNGVTKSLARIVVADFNNPAGLLSGSDSMMTTSANSGSAVVQQAGVGNNSSILSGQLEESNVDLSSEMTNMITTQYAYEANSKVITTSAQMLADLVQMGT